MGTLEAKALVALKSDGDKRDCMNSAKQLYLTLVTTPVAIWTRA